MLGYRLDLFHSQLDVVTTEASISRKEPR